MARMIAFGSMACALSLLVGCAHDIDIDASAVMPASMPARAIQAEASNAKPIGRQETHFSSRRLTVTWDGKWAAYADDKGGIVVVDMDRFEVAFTHSTPGRFIEQVAFSGNGTELYYSDYAWDDNSHNPTDVHVNKLEMARRKAECAVAVKVPFVSWLTASPNAGLIYYAAGNSMTPHGALIGAEIGASLIGPPVVFAADGRFLYGYACAIDMATGRVRGRDASADFAPCSIALSRDGKRLAVGSMVPMQLLAFHRDEPRLQVFASDTLELVKSWRAGPGISGDRFTAVSLSPDGRIVAAATGSGVVLLDVETGRVVDLLRMAEPVAVEFTPDGRLLVLFLGSRLGEWKR
jgi:hypothetical protein